MPFSSSRIHWRRALCATTGGALVAASLSIVGATPASATAPTWSAPVLVAQKPVALNSIAVGPLSGSGDQFTYDIGWNDGEQPWSGNGLANYVKVRTGPTTWGTETLLSPEKLYAGNPVISRDGKGVVWRQSDNQNAAPGLIGAMGNKNTSDGWQTPGTGVPATDTELPEFGPRGQIAGDLSISNKANRVMWKDNTTPGANHLWVADWSSSGVAGTPFDLATLGTGGTIHGGFVSGDGKHATWMQGNDPYQIYRAALGDSGWAAEVILTTSNTVEDVWGISYDGSTVIYGTEDDEIYGLHQVAGSWTTQAITDVSVDNSDDPSIAQDGSVAWQGDNGYGYVAQYRNGQWGSPVEVTQSIYSGNIRLSDNGSMVAWMEGSGAYDVFVRNYIDGEWTPPQNVSNGDGSYFDIELAGNGCALSWHHINDSRDLMYTHTNVACATAPVAASSSAAQSIDLTWDPASMGSSETTEYEAQAYLGDEPVSGKICTVTAPTTSCTLSGLTVGQTYTFKLRAKNSTGWGPTSALSNEATVTDSPATGKKCPLTVQGARAASARLPIGKRVVLVKRMTTASKCRLNVGVKKPRGDMGPRITVRVNKKTGRVVAKAFVANATARVSTVAVPKQEPYNKASRQWKRTWRS